MKSRRDIWQLFAPPQRVIRIKRICPECVRCSDHTHCYVCDTPLFFSRGPGWHISHLQAQKLNGPDDDYNLRICCSGCNLHMGTITPYAYAQQLGLTVDNSLAMCERVNNKYDAEVIYTLIYVEWFTKYNAVLRECDEAFAKAASFEGRNSERMRLEGGNVVGERGPNEDEDTLNSSSSSSSFVPSPLPVPSAPCVIRTSPGTVYPPIPTTGPFVPKTQLTKTIVAKSGTGKILKLSVPERDYIQKAVESCVASFIAGNEAKNGSGSGGWDDFFWGKVTYRLPFRTSDGQEIKGVYTANVITLTNECFRSFPKHLYGGIEEFFHEVLFHWCMNNGVTYTKTVENSVSSYTISFTSTERPHVSGAIPLESYPYVVHKRGNPSIVYVDGKFDSFAQVPGYISHEKYQETREDVLRRIEYYKEESAREISRYVSLYSGRYILDSGHYELDYYERGDCYEHTSRRDELKKHWVGKRQAVGCFLQPKDRFMTCYVDCVVFFDTEEHFAHDARIATNEEFASLQKRDRIRSNEAYHKNVFMIRIDYMNLEKVSHHLAEAVKKAQKGDKYYLSNPEIYSYLFPKSDPVSSSE